MNLKQLEIFIAVVDSASFSRGAEATYLTQSTVSQHISALEEEFGINLLDRTGRGAFPTEAGKLLYSYAKNLLFDARKIPIAINRFKGLEEAALVLGASTIPGTYIIPQALPSFLHRYPGVMITLLEGDSRDTLDRIRREEIEVGIIGSRFDDDDVEFSPLGRDVIVLVVNHAHPWRQRSAITLAELVTEPFILRESGSGTDKTVRETLRDKGIDPNTLRVRAYLGSNEAVKQAVIGGIGISFMSEVSIRKEVEQGELAVIDVSGFSIERRFYLITRGGRDLSPPARAFSSLILELFTSGATPPPLETR